MPSCGSQIILCDIPVRYDTYSGCSHACRYCFANRKADIRNIKTGESVASLRSFIDGKRTKLTEWCDWDIPLHWGGMSDPFQPAERTYKRSLDALRVFAETQYPFVVSTKNKMIAEGEYFELIKQCNCVVQFSAACEEYDKYEQGASTFRERIAAAEKIAPYKRVNIRCQPYIPGAFAPVMRNIPVFAKIGIHGVIFEGMKYQHLVKGTIKIGGDFCYPSPILHNHFLRFRDALHKHGMKFYCGENRLRGLSDELCCCGIEGMGWKENTANLNHAIYDRDGYVFTDAQKKPNSGGAIRVIHQAPTYNRRTIGMSYEQMMNEHYADPKFRAMLKPDGKI